MLLIIMLLIAHFYTLSLMRRDRKKWKALTTNLLGEIDFNIVYNVLERWNRVMLSCEIFLF